jgi:hypothetical protein
MVCMANICYTCYKEKTLVNLESATPAVDRPVGEVDRREVDKDVVCSLPIMPRSTAATLFSFINLYKKFSFIQEKRTKVFYSINNENEGTEFPKGLTLVQ